VRRSNGAGRVLALGVAIATMLTVTPPVAAVYGGPRSGDDRIETVVGTGEPGDSGDGGSATRARLGADLAMDRAMDGTLYIADRDNGRLRAVRTNGRIDTVPGTENIKPRDVAVTDDGTIFLANSSEVWRIADDGTTTQVATGGQQLEIASIEADAAGNVYVAEYWRDVPDDRGGRIWKIAPDGTTSVFAGGDDRYRSPEEFDHAPAVEANLQLPHGLALGPRGSLYFIDLWTDQTATVWQINSLGSISRVSDVDLDLGSDDEGLAVGADGTVYVLNNTLQGTGDIRVLEPNRREGTAAGPAFFGVEDVAVDADGRLYVATEGRVVRLPDDPTGSVVEDPVSGADPLADQDPGTVVTVARAGDGGAARLAHPTDVAVGADGAVYIADGAHLRQVRDGVVSDAADLSAIEGLDISIDEITPAAGGAMYVLAEVKANDAEAGTTDGLRGETPLVLRLQPGQANVPVEIVAGTPYGTLNFDGNIATGVTFTVPTISSSRNGRLYLGEIAGGPVYALTRDGTLRAVTEAPGKYGRGVGSPVAVDTDGAIYYTSEEPNRVFRIGATGTVDTIAGNGAASWASGETGDGDAATDAPLCCVRDIAIGPDGSVYLATEDGIRAVATGGTIDTLVPPDDKGESPDSLALDAHGNLYFLDTDSGQVQVLVRPGEISGIPWTLVWIGVAVVGTAGAGFLIFRRRRPRAPADSAVPPQPSHTAD
jgi:sugar lactone lactonase YvrE